MTLVSALARKSSAVRSHKSRRIDGSGIARLGHSKSVQATSRPTVLVVDDDAPFTRSLKRLLSVSGFQVETFASPSDLLTSTIPTSNACMMIDINLPEMTGIELFEILKASDRNLPTILITAKTDVRTRDMAARADPIAVLFKPFNEQPLLEAIDLALASSIKDRP